MNADLAPCPRCTQPLTEGAGALGEAACAGCGARFLDAAVVDRVRELFLRIEPSLFQEMARSGTPSAPCPRCATTLRVQRVRGVTVDLCAGCGGMLLDAGELLALSRGDVLEARAAPTAAEAGAAALRPAWMATSSLELARPARSSVPDVRWIVPCTHCDRELDLSTTNYAVNDRPWCADCVSEQGLGFWRHMLSLTLGPLLALMGFLFASSVHGGRRGIGPFRRRRPSSALGGGGPSMSIGAAAVVGKVPPEAALQAFGRFAQRAR